MNPTRPHNPMALPTPSAVPATSGEVTLRVRYCECDPMGVVHHAAYVPWLEMGRTELLRTAGVSYAELESAGVFLVIVKLECRYKRPARYDDIITVCTRVRGASRVKIDHEYEVVRQLGSGEREVCCTAATTLACVDGQGHVRQLPAWLSGEGMMGA